MIIARASTAAALLLVPTVGVGMWIRSADARLEAANAAPAPESEVATASASNEEYCSPELKKVLRRVLLSCGLVSGGEGRGCQPVQAKSVATLAGDDFNALFAPMQGRGGIIQFEQGRSELDDTDLALIDEMFADQRGASWFFVVARSSPEGSEDRNRELSRERAEAVMSHLRTSFDDPDLDNEVGLLWLGEEFAQLGDSFCDWRRSGDTCTSDDLNRSAFIAWIDCQL